MKILPLWSEQVQAKKKQKRSLLAKLVILSSIVIVVFSFQKTVAEEIKQRTIHTDSKNIRIGSELTVSMGLYTGKKMKMELEDSSKNKTAVSIEYDKEHKQIKLLDRHKLKPGKYTLYLYDDKDLVYKSDFLWGVLALNTDKSIYTKGDKVNLTFAVLDAKGDMVCDAYLELEIKNKLTDETTTLTTDKGIKVNDVCKLHAFTLTPDYEATYFPQGAGEYDLKLKAKVKGEEYEISDRFSVENSPSYDIKRSTVTRVYPIEEYPVIIDIKANKPFTGAIKETIPYDFAVSDLEGVRTFDKLVESDDKKYLIWDVILKKGESIKIGYKFDAPNKSPDLFTLGKLKLERSGKFLDINVSDNTSLLNEVEESSDSTEVSLTNRNKNQADDSLNKRGYNQSTGLIVARDVTEFEELRFWQLANDAVGQAYPTRIYTTGFELNSTTAGMEYDSNINTPAISSSTFRSGSYSLNTALGTSSTEGINHAFSNANKGTQHYIRVYLRIATAPSSEIKVLEVYSSAAASRAYVKMTSSMTLKLYDDSDTLIGSASSALSLNTWYRVELMIDSATGATAELTLKLDGTDVAKTTTGTLSSYNNFSLGILENATADLYWDDIAVNEEDIANEDNWPGEGSVVYLRPNANGTDTGWTNDYTKVDEVTPNDGTGSDYISCSSVSDIEDYGYQDSNAVGISSTDNIKLVEAWLRTGASAANSRNHNISIEYNGSKATPNIATPVSSTSWLTDDDASPIGSTHVVYSVPGGSPAEPITPLMLDSFTTELTTSDCSPVVNVTAMWLVVEYYATEGGRIFSSGFELQSTDAGIEWTTKTGSPTINTATKNGGAASLRISSLSSGAEKSLAYDFETSGTNTNGPLFFRTYLYIATAPGSANRILSIKNASGTAIAYLTLDNSRVLRLYDEDAIVGSASSALSASTWYRVEVKLDATGSGSNDTVEARINGTVFATGNTRNLSSGVRTLTLGANINSEANTTGDIYFDDVAVNKNIGTYQNSYPGVGKIAHIRPDGLGVVYAWTGDNTDIDEITPDGSTTQIFSGTENDVSRFTLDSTATAGITSGAHITLVSAGLHYKNLGAGSIALSLLDSAGYFIESDEIQSSGSFETNHESDPRTYPITMYTRPNVTNLWTTSELDSSIIGVRYINKSGSTNFFVSTLWVLVEYYDPIDVTGTCDAFDQTTDCGDTGTIRVAINNELVYAKQETISGSWTVDDIPKPATDDIVTVFIDGASDPDEAVSIAQYDGSGDITGVKLFKEHLVIGSDDNLNISNADLSSYDNSISGDEDVFFDVSSGNLTVDYTSQSSTEELYIDASDTYQPGGSVSTHDIEIDGTFTAEANAVTVSGSWDNDSNFSSTGTTSLTATTGTETIDSTGSSTNSFNNLTLGSGSGTATWNMSSALDVNNDLTISYGTLAQNGSNNVTLAGSLTIGASGNYTKSTGTFTFDGTTPETVTNSATIDNLGSVTINKTDTVAPSTNNKLTLASDIKLDTLTINGTGGQADTIDLGSSGYTLEIANVGSSATVLTNSGTFTAGTSTVKYSATNSGGNISIATVPYSSLQVSGSDTYVLTGNLTSTNAITGNLTIDSGATLDVTTAPYSISFNGNWSNGGTFTPRTGTVSIGGSGTSTVSGTTTFYNFSCTIPGKTIKFAYHTANSPYFTFQNILTLEGSSGSKINLESTLSTSRWLALFTIDQNTDSSPTSDLTIEYVNIKDSGCHPSNTKIAYNLVLGGSVNQGNDGSCWQFNQPPNSPSSLAQAKSDDTPLSLGAWTSGNPKFSVSGSDPDSSDTLYLCVERDIVGTSFSNTEDSCGTGVTYSGSPVALYLTSSSLTSDQPYHWQARVKDAGGEYSAWVSYGGNLESETDFGYDTTAPSGGTVYDGTSGGSDSAFNDGSLSTLSANWSGISSSASGLLRYEYSIGTTAGGTDIKTWTSNTTSTSVTASSLTLQTSKIYYFNVQAVDNAGNTSSYISSNGQAVAPTLAFSVSPSSVSFSNLNVGNSYQDTEATTLTTSTNAYNGYVIRAFISSLLTSPVNPSAQIINFNGGSYASPDEFRTTDLGFGYTSSDTSVQGSNKFGNNPCAGGGTPPCYSPFSVTAPGDIVADHTASVTGSAITNEQFTVTYKVKVPATQEALPYSTTVIYTITPIY
jgi:hypothetical protein